MINNLIFCPRDKKSIAIDLESSVDNSHTFLLI